MRWLLFSKVKLLAAGAVLLSLLAGLFQMFRLGKQSERNKQRAETLNAVRRKKEVDLEVEDLGSNDIDQRLARWLRDK